MSSIEIVLKRVDRIFRPHETIHGHILLDATNPFVHQGISLKVEGSVKLQLSAKSVGILEAFYNTIKPIELVCYHIPIQEGGKATVGQTEYPFEFRLHGMDELHQSLLETYHGVFISVVYEMSVDCIRGIMKKKLHQTLEFIVECPSKVAFPDQLQEFVITPDSLENLRKTNVTQLAPFRISGKIYRTNCPVNLPFTGEITIEQSDNAIKSIELQLIRIETISHTEGMTREATEIQNIQLAYGDVCRDFVIPIYMIFPRLFTCPTMSTGGFSVEFEVNVVVLFTNGYMITENFPIVLYRS